MKKNFVRVMLFGALALATVTYVGCKDYDDDIDNLQTQIDANKAGIATLQAKVDDGKWVTDVTDIEGGFKITFNNGDSYSIVNGAKGAEGKAGTKVTIDEVTKHWLFDGIDSGHSAVGPTGPKGETGAIGADGPKGETGATGPAGHSPFIGDGTGEFENGFWYFYDDNTSKWVKGDSAESSIYLVQGDGIPSATLHVKDQTTGKFVNVTLPTGQLITGIKGVEITSEGKITTGGTKEVELKYGVCASDFTFNGDKYEKDQMLYSATSVVNALINPIPAKLADIENYKISLKDSKGNAPFIISKIAQNKTVNPLTRAEAAPTVNRGVYDLTISINKATDAPVAAAEAAYALCTYDAWNNEIISAYDVKIKSTKITGQTTELSDATVSAEVGKELVLDDLVAVATAAPAATNAIAATPVMDLSTVYAYYYELAADAPKDIKLSQRESDGKWIISSPTGQSVNVNVCYLTADGKPYDGVERSSGTTPANDGSGSSVTNKPAKLTVTFKKVETVTLAKQKVDWNTTEKSDIAVSDDNIEAIKAAITTDKISNSTPVASTADKVKFSGLGSSTSKYDALKLTVAAAYLGSMDAVLTVDIDATKQIVFKLPVTVAYSVPTFTKNENMWNGDKVSLLIKETVEEVAPAANSGDDTETPAAPKLKSISIEREMSSIFTNWSDITDALTAKKYSGISYTASKNGENAVGSVTSHKFTVDIAKATNDMALTINVNCTPGGGESESIAEQEVKFLPLKDLLTQTFGAADTKKGITKEYTAKSKTEEVDVLGDLVWKDRHDKTMWPEVDDKAFDYGSGKTFETADNVLAMYGYAIKVELSDKTNFTLSGNKVKLTNASAHSGIQKDLKVTVTITPTINWNKSNSPAAVVKTVTFPTTLFTD